MIPRAPLILAMMLSLPAAAIALDVHPSLSASGWFFSVDGTIEGSDLGALGFDRSKGQPEIVGGLALGRHHLEVTYLRVRRAEEGTASGQILGVFQTNDQVSVDLAVDYVRGHYGYSLVSNPTIDVEPFLEVGYLHEVTDIVDQTAGQSTRSDESSVFPLPGLGLRLFPSFPVHLQARGTGIGTGSGHLIDVQGGLEGGFQWLFGGLGYRYVDFLLDDNVGERVADVQLKGVYVQGGVRF